MQKKEWRKNKEKKHEVFSAGIFEFINGKERERKIRFTGSGKFLMDNVTSDFCYVTICARIQVFFN